MPFKFISTISSRKKRETNSKHFWMWRIRLNRYFPQSARACSQKPSICINSLITFFSLQRFHRSVYANELFFSNITVALSYAAYQRFMNTFKPARIIVFHHDNYHGFVYRLCYISWNWTHVNCMDSITAWSIGGRHGIYLFFPKTTHDFVFRKFLTNNNMQFHLLTLPNHFLHKLLSNRIIGNLSAK